jgi:superfamily II DNA or RNA helicase
MGARLDLADTAPHGTVRHPTFGHGRVLHTVGDLLIVRFPHGIEQVLAASVTVVASVEGALGSGALADPLSAVVRLQALAIRSVNDRWGVFSRSRVKLLPHQLWVCRRVREQWPFRWLVADDVGLGKTIEAGLVISPLVASGQVKRLLVLTPSRLAGQWQQRLKQMFDIRLSLYAAEVDQPRLDFWGTNRMVVASFHTLRENLRGQRDRLLAAEPWDLVVVDEAHHLNADERTGTTLAYDLLADLDAAGKLNSLLFFTGTPHRGKDFGFASLMRLLRPNEFDPRKPLGPQLPLLRGAMIRNNKASVTDLEGRKLFTNLHVQARDHSHSPEEAAFYETMTAFILDGRAYASGLTGRARSARMLLLIALQKLAASSIAAIRSALRRRRQMLATSPGVSDASEPTPALDPDATADEMAEAEEALPARLALALMRDEVARLDELIALADRVTGEAKIERLLALISNELPDSEPALLFTEYKATQALVVNALHQRFGHGTAGFINGDDHLDGLEDARGHVRRMTSKREAAADAFNDGRLRFLVSTEAGGEGIDLQQRCATLVHVDMPWNPMRLHQRVGRLWRYGQRRDVTAYILRNPDTVEARIWTLLDEKLRRIQAALSASMDDPEDAMQLVLGISSVGLFDDLFAGSMGKPGEGLSSWFNTETAQLGGEDALTVVKRMLGSVDRFDFGKVGEDLPRADLPDLEPFFTNAVQRHRRRLLRTPSGLDLPNTPDAWRSADLGGIRTRYDGLVFDRSVSGQNAAARVLGVGHGLVDVALAEALAIEAPAARVDGVSWPLLVVGVEDQVTGQRRPVARLLFGATLQDGQVNVLRDWELLRRLAAVRVRTENVSPAPQPVTTAELQSHSKLAAALVPERLPLLEEFTRPVIVQEAFLLPLT